MTTSGTTSFNPSLGELTIYAFGLCGLRPAALLQEHMQSARMAANLLLGRWSSVGVNLWKVDLQTITLSQGTATYSVPANTIAILDAYATETSTGQDINRILTPISRSEYASYPNPQQQGAVTVFWFDRLLSPSVTFFQTPDGTIPTVSYYRVSQIQDANFTSGQTVELPVYFLEAFAFGLAQRLAMVWAPEKAVMLKTMADEAFAIAADQNTENAQFYVSPQLSSYWQT